MRFALTILASCVFAGLGRADEPRPAAGLTAKEAADGWVMLFDGETTFGWTIDGEAKVDGGKLILGGKRATTASVTPHFGNFEMAYKYDWKGERPSSKNPFFDKHFDGDRGTIAGTRSSEGTSPTASTPFEVTIPAGGTIQIHYCKLFPKMTGSQDSSLFNGKDLSGWKVFKGEPRRKSAFTVTKDGWLNVKDGAGDLQTERQFDNFVLQLECISNGKHLNSGIFFRCLPGQYQQGYEAQIRNEFKDGDRTRPVDFGTGAIYRRQAARKVVSTDGEWFTMTVYANENRLMTWVNGYPTADFTDTRPANENGRNGSKTGAGAISIQGHDPTTDLSFRNIRIQELPKKK